ncbi:MAG: DUF4348 domain-containing protein [Phocaeicola sp.]
MKKIVIGASLFLLVSSCVGSRKQQSDGSMIDSLALSISESLHSTSEEPVVVPSNADESFIDFLYNFSLNEKLQRSRITFPLPSHSVGHTEYLVKEGWKHEELFAKLEAYTVLFDCEEEMELEKDELTNAVKLEWIYLEEKEVKSYSFERESGIWKLKSIEVLPFSSEEAAPESFYSFYHQFINDSLFQKRLLAKPLKFVTTDPDDEFQIIETTMDYEQFLSYKSALPTFLTNVNYGQALMADSRTKVVELKGFGNGFNNTLYFEKRGKEWRLVQYEDLGD